MRPSALVLALGLALPGALVAQHAGHHAPAARPAVAKVAAKRAAAPRVVTIKTMDYAFEAPASIPAGTTTFRIENAGKELHHVWLVKLEQGKTVGDYLQALQAVAKGEAPPPSWAVDVGGPQPGVPGALADGTLTLDAGNYVIVCHIPAPDGQPHIAKGMYKPLTVTPSREAADEAKADLTMTLKDYGFEFSTPLTAGRRTIRIVNAAEQFHEAFIVKLAPGKTTKDALAWVEGGMKGPPPMMPVGGASGLAKGRSMQFTADFAEGEYGLLCFLPDAKDGKPHVAHGMFTQITVAKK
ncbi:hypothetical protein [Roseisolibacter sp. H3M3-2]|uniref:hypothetical protein n=1 Tax=Roseisolibacter sp. H3M3-2 TaxID=3031323 RepID=UPI0023DA2675|nr:hypothetical protein [Roseisolibacter sp. H3M3-2]MDF1504642.1 hypothetical protein [Roseisolibacter sp. H3M3-2]